MLKIVTKKLIPPKIDLTPAKWRLKIAKSTELPLWNKIFLRGGYTVHPVPAPFLVNILINISISAGGNNQNLKLFNRG